VLTSPRSRHRGPSDGSIDYLLGLCRAATKLLCLVLRDISQNWKNAQREWTAAMTQFAIMFGHRFGAE
jgi:hypothetical protein